MTERLSGPYGAQQATPTWRALYLKVTEHFAGIESASLSRQKRRAIKRNIAKLEFTALKASLRKRRKGAR